MAELKPCPFCGSEADFISFVDVVSHRPACVVKCVKCGTQTRDFVAEDNTFSYREQAKEQWNTRTPKERGGESCTIAFDNGTFINSSAKIEDIEKAINELI